MSGIAMKAKQEGQRTNFTARNLDRSVSQLKHMEGPTQLKNALAYTRSTQVETGTRLGYLANNLSADKGVAIVQRMGDNVVQRCDPKDKKPSEGSSTEVAAYEDLEPGTLSNADARRWYLDQEARIPALLDRSKSWEEQARQAFAFRNQIRTQARALMADRDAAAELDRNDPNLTWEEIVDKYKKRGFSGDNVYQEIVQSAQRSRRSVNQSLGLETGGGNGNNDSETH